jgi:hypothetical protein
MENKTTREIEQEVKQLAQRILNSRLSWDAIERALVRLSQRYPGVRVSLDAACPEHEGRDTGEAGEAG